MIKNIFGIFFLLNYLYVKLRPRRRIGEIYIPNFNLLFFVFSAITLIISTYVLIYKITHFYVAKTKKMPKNKIFKFILIITLRVLSFFLDIFTEVYKNFVDKIPMKSRFVGFVIRCHGIVYKEKLIARIYKFLATYVFLSGRLIVAICFFLDVCIFNYFWLFPKVVVSFGMLQIFILVMERVYARIHDKIIQEMKANFNIIYTVGAYKYIEHIGVHNHGINYIKCDENCIKNHKYDYLRTDEITQYLYYWFIISARNDIALEYIMFRVNNRYITILSSAFFLLGSYKLFYLQVYALLKIIASIQQLPIGIL